MKTLPNITSLRFFLASLVMVFHIPLFFHNRGIPTFNDLPVLNKGSEAVYMFFSLSGFLIFRQLFSELTINNKIDFKKFYMRRALRIFPLYYLVVFIGLIYYNVFLPTIGMPVQRNYDLTEGIFLLITFFPNILTVYKPGGIIEMLWSIGVEEQCYILIAPLFVLVPKKYMKVFFLFLSFILVYLYECSSITFLKEYRMIFFYFSFAGFCSLLKIKDFKYRKIIEIIIYVLMILYFTTNIFLNSLSDLGYYIFSMILFGCFLIVFTIRPFSFFENKKLNYLGKISYGIYMYHAIVMQLAGFVFIKVLARYKINDTAIIFLSFFVVTLITIFVAHISYTYYEKKFLNMKKNYRTIP